MNDSEDAPIDESALFELTELVAAYRNVPPRLEAPFRIHNKFPIAGSVGGPVLLHDGFELGESRPDWASLKRLAGAGFLMFAHESNENSYMPYSYDTVEITEKGFQLVDTAHSFGQKDRDQGPRNNEVWVVYGRNRAARDLMFNMLRAAGLKPLDFDHGGDLTGSASPYIGQVLEDAFKRAQAVLVLLTDDEEVCLREMFRGSSDPGTVEYQARPNVIFEAGMAMALHPERTVIVEMGSVRQISDYLGRHVVHWHDGGYSDRHKILQKLHTAGCPVEFHRSDWSTVDAETELNLLVNPLPKPCGQSGLNNIVPSNRSPSESDEYDTVSLSNEIGEISEGISSEWTFQRSTDLYEIEEAKQALAATESRLAAIRNSRYLKERPVLHAPMDTVRSEMKRLVRERPPKNEFRIKEFWWAGEESIERLQRFHGTMKAVVERGVEPADSVAWHQLLADKACVRLALEPDHNLGSNFRHDWLLVGLPVTNEGKALARDVKLLSVDSELDQNQSPPEGKISILKPNHQEELYFSYRPLYLEGAAVAQESRFRLRIGFRDDLGEDIVGYAIQVLDVGNRTFHARVVRGRMVASPLCPRLFAEAADQHRPC